MCPRIWIFDSYSLFIALGIIAAILLFEYYGHAQKVKRLTRSITEVLAVAAALFGFLGAWLFQNLYDYIASPATFSFSSKMTFFGGLLTGCAFFLPLYFLFIKRKDEAGFKAIFPIAPACISLCHAFGRIGDAGLLSEVLRSKLGDLRSSGTSAYIIGAENYGSDLERFLGDLRGEDIEMRALSAYLPDA